MSEKIKMVKCMEFIMRHLNNEDHLDRWLCYGVADGDIEFGDVSIDDMDKETLGYYIAEGFKELTELFLSICKDAHKDGGLYV